MESRKVFAKYHWLALGILIGVSIMTGCIWYAVPTRAQSAISIPIQNPSFETPIALPGVINDPAGCGNYAGTIPGWVMQPLAAGSGGGVARWTCQTPPDGSMVAFLGYGMRMVQDLRTPAQPGTYTLQFYVANWFFNYTAPWSATIWVGGKDIPIQGTRYSNPVCTISGYGVYDFKLKPLVCEMPSYIAPNNGFGWPNFTNDGIAGDLVISIDGTGWTVMPDKVSMSFVPET